MVGRSKWGRVSAAALLAGLVWSGDARSQGTDITRMTCAQLSEINAGDREQFLVWLYGYYAGSAQKPVIDQGAFAAASQALTQLCDKQKAAPLIGAEVRALFLGGQPAGQQQPAPTLSGNVLPVPPIAGPAGIQQVPSAATGAAPASRPTPVQR